MANTTQSLPDLYATYKNHTKYALSWLSSMCHLKYASFNSTEDILKAAVKLRAQNCAVPRTVISALSDAIAARWKVFDIYQSFPVSTDSKDDNDRKHKAFIRRLEKVLRTLQPIESKIAPMRPGLPPRTETATFESASNRFTALDDFDTPCKAEENAVETEKKTSTNMEYGTLDQSLQPSPQEILLQDDDIGEWIELSYYLYELDTICQQVNTYWQEAAKQQIPIPLAAWLSTTALHAVSRISARLEAHTPTYDTLVSKWFVHKCKGVKIRFTHIPELKCQAGGRLADDLALSHIGQILEHCRSSEEYQKILPEAGKRQEPFSIIHRPISHGAMGSTFDADDIALDQMQESMRQLLASRRAIAELEISEEDQHVSEPLLPLMSQILRNTSAPIPIQLVFGMEMLLSTYKIFLWPDGEPNRRNCRIEALQFANEVSSSISATLSAIDGISDSSTPTLKIKSLILHMRAESLQKYAREQRFDLYYQAPWTAGCHMVEILDMAFSDGLRLCCELGYVCAVLHLYNSLRQLDSPISQIVLLEQLCQVFLGPLFIGTLPSENFSSHFRRALGQRAKKKDDSNMATSRLSRATATSTRPVAPSKLSVFYDLHGSYYETTPDFWVRIYADSTSQRTSQSQIRETMNLVHSVPFNVPLDKIKTRALSEFSSEIPIMRINFFAIFRLCLQLLQGFGETLDQHPGISAKGKAVPLGFAYVDHILDAIVEHVKDDSKRKLMPYWRELNVTKTVFMNVDASISISDFLWTI